jgi:hypothetical protein
VTTQEPNVSVAWNGIVYTAHANKGARFGTGTGRTEDEARAAAIKDLEDDPERKAPEHGGAHSTAATDPARVEAKNAGKTGG